MVGRTVAFGQEEEDGESCFPLSIFLPLSHLRQIRQRKMKRERRKKVYITKVMNPCLGAKTTNISVGQGVGRQDGGGLLPESIGWMLVTEGRAG